MLDLRTSIVVVALLLHAMPANAQIVRTRADSVRILDRARAARAMVEMPSVVDRSLEEAQQACSAARLPPTAVRIDGGDPAARDIVVRQSPAAEQVVVAGTACTLYVRPQPQDVPSTPNLLGLSRRAALLLINRNKLTPRVTTAPSPDTALGSVIAQNPLPGTPIRLDRTIDVQIAGVPRVVGLSVDAAEAALQRARLAWTTTIRELAEGGDGMVVEQFPQPGQAAEPGSSVALTVARVVEPRFAMPDLVGRPLEQARGILAESGLILQRLEIATVDGRPDTAVAQSPAAGSPVRRGDPVTLTNGRPVTAVSAVVAVPNFVGVRIDGVPKIPGADSLRIVARYAAPARKSRDSIVVAQSLAAGARVPIGSAISLTVSQRQVAQLTSLRVSDSVSIAVGESVRLSVLGVMSDGSLIAVTPAWTASTGSIASDGRYVATGASGRVVVTATFRGLAATSVIRVVPRSSWSWWWISAIAGVVAAIGWGAWRLLARPDPLPTPPSTAPVPPLAFTYDVEVPSVETEITATHGHGSSLSLVSYAGDSDHSIEPAGVELFNAESTHG